MENSDIDFEEQCSHLPECQASSRVLFHLDRCEQCEIAEKFKPIEKVMT